MSVTDAVIQLADRHWFLYLCTLPMLVALWIGTLKLVYILLNRILRTIKVVFRGWPPNIFMDADGDIVFPSALMSNTVVKEGHETT